MVQAGDLQPLTGSLWLWQDYDPAAKADLFSSAAKIEGRLFFIDPIPLNDQSISELTAGCDVAGVIITNANHVRAAKLFATKYRAAIFGSTAALSEFGHARTIAIAPGEKIVEGIDVIAIEGAAAGEIALHLSDDGGTIIVGDALINFEPYGFTLLPAKYCADQALLRRSLRQLLDRQFARVLFAHGIPILSSARARLEALLANDR